VVVFVIMRSEKADSAAFDVCGVRYTEAEAETEVAIANHENGAFHYFFEESWLQ
jgi:hypothetical protein